MDPPIICNNSIEGGPLHGLAESASNNVPLLRDLHLLIC